MPWKPTKNHKKTWKYLENPWKPTKNQEKPWNYLEKHENQPRAMKNLETTSKCHENQPRTIKNVKIPWKPMKTNQEPRNPVKLHWKTMKTSQKPNREAKYNVLNGHYGDISKCDIISTTIISSRFGLWHWSLMKDTLPAAPRWRDFPTSRYFFNCCTLELSRTDQ